MHAIRTKYHGATDTHGACITAVCDSQRAKVSYDHALDELENHRAACAALLAKLAKHSDTWGPIGVWVCGTNDRDRVWVNAKAFLDFGFEQGWQGAKASSK